MDLQNQKLIESDDDDSFSYIEAMIDHSEGGMIGLEQAHHSYMQRTLASRGAFAVLSVHYSKYYIKKPEILLGRKTEDFIVDIDLGREGYCANKVSRRQAIINLEEDGSFHLKNIGKCSVHINCKEVAHGQSLSLTSGSMIEIRDIVFIFETNQTCVQQYLNGVALTKLSLGAPC